jgi:hypothetical protein
LPPPVDLPWLLTLGASGERGYQALGELIHPHVLRLASTPTFAATLALVHLGRVNLLHREEGAKLDFWVGWDRERGDNRFRERIDVVLKWDTAATALGIATAPTGA